jgi:hypothetical protein
VHSVTVYLKDNLGSSSSSTFIVTVINEAPILTQPVPTEVVVLFGDTLLYALPAAKDPES